MAARVPRKKKQEAIDLLAGGAITYQQCSEMVGITMKTLRLWRKDPEFSKQVLERSRELVQEHLPDVYKALLTKALSGDTQALKLYVEHFERLESMRSSVEHGQISFTWRSV